jgi:hypothetical protein
MTKQKDEGTIRGREKNEEHSKAREGRKNGICKMKENEKGSG